MLKCVTWRRREDASTRLDSSAAKSSDISSWVLSCEGQHILFLILTLYLSFAAILWICSQYPQKDWKQALDMQAHTSYTCMSIYIYEYDFLIRDFTLGLLNPWKFRTSVSPDVDCYDITRRWHTESGILCFLKWPNDGKLGLHKLSSEWSSARCISLFYFFFLQVHFICAVWD